MHIFRISEQIKTSRLVRVTTSKLVMHFSGESYKVQSIKWVGYKRSQLPTLNSLLGTGLVQ